MTTLRKAFTLLASFVLFPKSLGLGHPVGAALVFCSAFVPKKTKAHVGQKKEREVLGVATGDERRALLSVEHDEAV